jgi:microcystin-dependent protein
MANEPYLGAIFMFAGNFAPRGYALCQGQLLAISQNTALFSILGTTYGGNGVNNFALPDLRGRGPIGQGQGPGLPNITLGEVGGNSSVTILTSNLPSHTHTINVSTASAGQGSPQNNFPASIVDSVGGASNGYNSSATGGATFNPGAVNLTGNNIPLNIQDPYLGINYIIALQGIFPSRN